MNTNADKAQKKKTESVANAVSQKQGRGKSTFQFVDNHSGVDAQRKLQGMMKNSPHAMQLRAFQEMVDNYFSRSQQPFQKKDNNTGLPDNLKSGIENLSGYSMDDVKVHYNSEKPAKLQAYAYAQGTDIHIASGHEKDLPHEAWHVVQQKQGRVKPTTQIIDKVNVNDEVGLEEEADIRGREASQRKHSDPVVTGSSLQTSTLQPKKRFMSSCPSTRVGGGTFQAVRFRHLFQLAPEDGVIQRLIHLNMPPAGLPAEVKADQLLERLHPLIRYKTLAPKTRGYIIDLLDKYDEDDRTFDDLVDLAVTLEMDVRKEEPDIDGILIQDEDAEIIADPKFQKMLESVPLPAIAQRKLASEIKTHSASMVDTYRKLSAVVKQRNTSPENILKWFTRKTQAFALAIINAARTAFGLPSAPMTILIAGSGARQEMFPGSDLDLAAVTDTTQKQDVIAIFDFMQKVEKVLKLTVQTMSHELTGRSSDEVGLGPDTGVFGFRNSPELLAKHSLEMQNTGQDAELLVATKNAREQGVGERFFKARNELTTEKYGLGKLREILVEFPPPPPLNGIMDIKKQFLRMPTLALRDLAQICRLKSTNSFDRVRELVNKGYLDSTMGKSVIDALNHIAGVRLQCHVHYGEEKETFAVTDSDRRDGNDYVLTSSERKALAMSRVILNKFYTRLFEYQLKRTNKKWGILTGKSI